MPIHDSEEPSQPLSRQLIGSHSKLNLGCGFDHRKDYLNVDMHAFTNPDLLANVTDLSMLPSAAYDEILAQDVLEHFRWSDTPRALFEWNRLLKKGGSLFIRTTYIVGLAKRFEYATFQDINIQKLLVINLFSSQTMTGDYHLTTFSEKLLRYYLWETGYQIENIKVQSEWLFDVHASKVIEYYDAELLSPKLSDIKFINAVYQSILGREPDVDGLRGWVDKLFRHEIDRRSVIRTFLLSSEREEKMASTCPRFELIFDKPR